MTAGWGTSPHRPAATGSPARNCPQNYPARGAHDRSRMSPGASGVARAELRKNDLSLFVYAIHPIFSDCAVERPLDPSAPRTDCPRQEHCRQSQRAQAATQTHARAGRYRRLLRIGYRAGDCRHRL